VLISWSGKAFEFSSTGFSFLDCTYYPNLRKIIILPLAFILSAYAAWLIIPILLIGGVYLSYEGAEKIWEWFHNIKHKKVKLKPIATEEATPEALVQHEAKKIKDAIRTDFILSVEIIVIALESVIEQPFLTQILVVSLIALIATVAVYGLVALMVRMDDVGFDLQKKSQNSDDSFSKTMYLTGTLLIAALPKLIRILTIVGTIAMLLVGGGMFVHNIEIVHDLLAFLPSLLSDFIAGLTIGFVAIGIIHLINRPKQGDIS